MRRAMLADVAELTARTAASTGVAEIDPKVMDAIGRVLRHEFVPPELAGSAYENRPLRIGYGQTISQPYIVALMTHLIAPETHHRVLEVGTGSGYQAAVLAELVDRVHTIEIVPGLALEATERLSRLGYENVEVRLGDGYFGWPAAEPFNAIVVTAAASHVPAAPRCPACSLRRAGHPCRSTVFRADAASGTETCGRPGERAPDPSGAFRATDGRSLSLPGESTFTPGSSAAMPLSAGNNPLPRMSCTYLLRAECFRTSTIPDLLRLRQGRPVGAFPAFPDRRLPGRCHVRSPGMNGENQSPSFLLLIAVAILSAAAIGYEILLTRLFAIVQWHHFAFMVISIALLGFGASGTFLLVLGDRIRLRAEPFLALAALAFALAAPSCFAIAQRVPFNVLEFPWSLRPFGWLLLVELLVAVPFFLAATGIGRMLIVFGGQLSRVYAADLLGAGTGAIAAVYLLTWLPAERTLDGLGAMASLASGLAAVSARGRTRTALLSLAVIAFVGLVFGAGSNELRISPFKPLPQALRVAGAVPRRNPVRSARPGGRGRERTRFPFAGRRG